MISATDGAMIFAWLPSPDGALPVFGETGPFGGMGDAGGLGVFGFGCHQLTSLRPFPFVNTLQRIIILSMTALSPHSQIKFANRMPAAGCKSVLAQIITIRTHPAKPAN